MVQRLLACCHGVALSCAVAAEYVLICGGVLVKREGGREGTTVRLTRLKTKIVHGSQVEVSVVW